MVLVNTYQIRSLCGIWTVQSGLDASLSLYDKTHKLTFT